MLGILQEWLSTEASRGPHTALTLVNLETKTISRVEEIKGGFIENMVFENDNINFIKGGWDKRLRIKVNKKKTIFTFTIDWRMEKTLKDIETREDIYLLVDTFYGRIREDQLLGPIFNHHIEQDEWPEHLEKLTGFWAANLLGIPIKKKVNPVLKHHLVDKNLNYNVQQGHFERWLHIWFGTLNDLYKGEIADFAKRKAKNMANGQFMAIFRQRPEELR
jgi:hemoglobin